MVEEVPSQYSLGICTSAMKRKTNKPPDQMTNQPNNQPTKTKVMKWGGRRCFSWIVREGLSEKASCEPSPEK